MQHTGHRDVAFVRAAPRRGIGEAGGGRSSPRWPWRESSRARKVPDYSGWAAQEPGALLRVIGATALAAWAVTAPVIDKPHSFDADALTDHGVGELETFYAVLSRVYGRGVRVGRPFWSGRSLT